MSNYTYPKALLTSKDLVSIGYPKRIVDEIAHIQGAKSVIKRDRGSGSNIYFLANLIEEDLLEWKKINCR